MKHPEFSTCSPDAPPSAEDSALRALAASYNDFGQRIFASLAKQSGNIVYSPYSAGVCFAMAMSGARGATQAQFLEIMRLPGQASETEAANGKLAALLASYTEDWIDPELVRKVRRRLAKELEKARRGQQWNSEAEEGARLGALADVLSALSKEPRIDETQLEKLWGLFAEEGAQGSCDRETASDAQGGATPIKLDIANLLAITSREGQSLVAPKYRELLRERYDAEVFENAADADIDAWAAKRTRGHITHVATWDFPPEFVLLNAVYFNGRWEDPFREEATENLPFATAPGQSIDVPTMQKTTHSHYLEGEGFKAVWFPYSPAALGMAVVLPDRGVAPNALAGRLGEHGLPELADRLLQRARRKVEVRLPRFSTRYNESLKAPAQAAGLRLPFELGRADFGGVTGRNEAGRLFVGDVWQQATVDVTEQGTVATAVTLMEAPLTGHYERPPPLTPFHVDRPFLFYILDVNSGAILFQGRIDDPR